MSYLLWSPPHTMQKVAPPTNYKNLQPHPSTLGCKPKLTLKTFAEFIIISFTILRRRWGQRSYVNHRTGKCCLTVVYWFQASDGICSRKSKWYFASSNKRLELVLTNTVKQAAALAAPQLQPIPLSLPAAAVGATVSSSLNHAPASQQNSTPTWSCEMRILSMLILYCCMVY